MDNLGRSQNPEAVKVIIFRAAEAIVSELGASQLTFETLSARTEIAEPDIRSLFPDREALLTAMIEYRLERFRVRWCAYESVLPY